MKPTLSQVCSLNSAFDLDIEDYAAGQCVSIELWLTKLERFLHFSSVALIREILAQQGVTVEVASYQGGLLTSQGDARIAAWDLFKTRLKLCHDLKIKTLVVACDAHGALSQQDFERVQSSLRQVAEIAQEHDVRVALEFNAGATLGNNLQTAVALVEDTASANLGICFDAFHYYVGPSKPEDLQLLSNENLFHVQLCDLSDTARELAADSDRILPGDGDIPLAPIVDRLREIQYGGCVSVELMNPQIWQIPPRQFGEIAMTALRGVLGQAGMS